MDTFSGEGRILWVLKQELKAKGLHYRDIAPRLRVSESTLKRYFNSGGITIADLLKLADIAGLDLQSLAAMAEEKNAAEHKFTKAQQVALTRNKSLTAIYFLLWRGWTPQQISQEFEITNELDVALTKLESWGLIRRSAQGVKILATPSAAQRGSGLDVAVHSASQFLSGLDIRDPNCEWTFLVGRLSRMSLLQLREMIQKFQEDVHALTKSDSALPKAEVQWYRLFIGAQPTDRKKLLAKS